MKSKQSSDYEISNFRENESSYQNSQCIKKEKKLKLKLKKQRIYKQKTHGLWRLDEEEKFMNYMKQNRKIFEDKDSRRSNKIFRQMAKFLGTRSSEQCRSHHQKYQIRFITFDNIMLHIESKILDDRKKSQPHLNNFPYPIKKQQSIERNPLNVSNSYKINLENPNIQQKQAKDPLGLKEKLSDKAKTTMSSSGELIQEKSGYKMERKISKKYMEITICLNLDNFFADE